MNNLPSGAFDMLTVPSPVEGLRLRPASAGCRSGLGKGEALINNKVREVKAKVYSSELEETLDVISDE